MLLYLECQLNFPRASISDYVKISPALSKAFTKFTLMFWLRVPSSYQKVIQIFSYETSDGKSKFKLLKKTTGVMDMKINGDLK